MEKKIFKYIALEQEFYEGKYRYTRVVGGSQTNDTFIEEVA